MNVVNGTNLGLCVSRINKMARDLNKITSDSFTETADIYKLATDIILEAHEIRKICHERTGTIPRFNNIVDESMRILDGEA